jgi:hypothetical protein
VDICSILARLDFLQVLNNFYSFNAHEFHDQVTHFSICLLRALVHNHTARPRQTGISQTGCGKNCICL